MTEQSYRIVNAYYKINTALDNNIYIYAYIQRQATKFLEITKCDIRPYFFTRQAISHSLVIKSEKFDAYNGVFYKHTVLVPQNVRAVREYCQQNNIETFEADIQWVYRYFIDKQYSLGDEKLTKLYYDIETENPSGRMPDATIDKIKCISCIDEAGEVMWFGDGTEEQIILDFLQYADKYSLLLAWYGGVPDRKNKDGFDVRYICTRIDRLNLAEKFDKDCRNSFDVMRHWAFGDSLVQYKYTRLYPVKSYSLANVAHVEVGAEKLSKAALYTEDKQKLREYSVRDVEILRAVDQKLQVSDLFDNFAKIGNVLYTDSRYYSKISDILVLTNSQTFYAKRYIHKNKTVVTEEVYNNRLKGSGGYVAEPKAGVHKNVLLLDFASLYPNIIRTFNISFENKTLIEQDTVIVPGNKIRFTTQPAIYPSLIKQFTELREQYKKQLQKCEVNSDEYFKWRSLEQSTKYLTNSVWGVYRYVGCRYKDEQSGEAITTTGQFLVKKIKDILNNHGYDVIYSDTDSGFVIGKSDTVEKLVQEGEQIKTMVNQQLKQLLTTEYSVPEQFYNIQLELDSVFSKILFLQHTKKRYTGNLIYRNGKLTNTLLNVGIESKRSDACELVQQLLTDVINMILQEKTEQQIKKFLLDERKKLFSANYDSKLIITKAMKRLFDEYTMTPIHIRVAIDDQKKYNTQYYLGDKIPYVVTSHNGGLQAVHAERTSGAKPDYQYYWEYQVYPACHRIISSVFPSFVLTSKLSEFV